MIMSMSENEVTLKWVVETADAIKKKMPAVCERSRNILPYTTVNGRFDDWTAHDVGWWTNGFWGGMMWQLYKATKNVLYKEIACDVEKKLDKALFNALGMDHDSGFRWLTTAVADYKITGDMESYNRGLMAADNLAGRFNPNGNFIRAWNDNGDGSKAGWAIIDCMMNLPLLYWAYEERNDARYRNIAMKHADMAMKNFVREDGSVKHIISINPENGEYIESFGGQGFGEGSSWTRGQAWAIYGFALSFLHTHEERYIKTAMKVADYFISSMEEWHGILGDKEGYFIPVDFRQPKNVLLEDSTAAAIAACGLLEINRLTASDTRYSEAALKLLRTLAKSRCNWSDEADNILEKCTAAYHDEKHEFSIIYGDYYFIEAIWKLTGEELFIW